MTRFRIAHLSDPHLGPLPRPPVLSLASKRVFGYINWQRNRRHALGADVLAALVNDMIRHTPDHICVTGDLVNIALPEEFENATAWLSDLGDPGIVSVIPGNHDAYVPGAKDRAARMWARWSCDAHRRGFPFARRRDGVLVIGVSTAIATPPFVARGKVGTKQARALANLLDANDDAFKVVMIHHPPDPSEARGRRGLADIGPVREVLAAGCADLVLHGHTHRAALHWLDTPRGRAAVLGVPSASSDGTHHPPGGYSLLDIDPDTHAVHLTRRTFDPERETVATIERIDLDLRPRAA